MCIMYVHVHNLYCTKNIELEISCGVTYVVKIKGCKLLLVGTKLIRLFRKPLVT